MATDPQVVFRVHALEQMFERDISQVEVLDVLEHGVEIEENPDALPNPTKLLLGWVEKRPLHVVASFLNDPPSIIVITAYQPELARWEPGFRSRRKAK